MFGNNEIVDQSYFKEDEDEQARLLVSSIYFSLQGEGPFAGRPAVFISLAKCNLACSFCHTFFDSGTAYTLQYLRGMINELLFTTFAGNALLPQWARLEVDGEDGHIRKKREMVLVVTGGEPMLQPTLGPFLETMSDLYVWTQVESNGLIMQPIPDSTVLVVSPKCADNKYPEPSVQALVRADCLKFVMSADPDSPYHEIPQWALDWMVVTNRPVYAMPMTCYPAGVPIVEDTGSFWDEAVYDNEQNRKNHEWTAEYCLRTGVFMTTQMQLFSGVK